LIRPNAYDVERRLASSARGGAPGGAALGELPAATGEEASGSQRGGTLRRLGIATVRHRVVHVALKLVLEPSSEADE
jgi:hypothetical protein